MPMPLIKSAYKSLSLAAAVPESCAFCVLPSVAEPYQIKAGGGAFLCIRYIVFVYTYMRVILFTVASAEQ